MRRPKLLSLALVASVWIAGCADGPTEPAPAPEGPALSQAGQATQEVRGPTTDRHLVVFEDTRGIPSGFADGVAALGGTVELEIAAVGAAVVSGLDAAGAAELGASREVTVVEPELLIDLPEPGLLSEPELAGATPASPGDPTTAFFFPRQWHLRAIDAPGAWAGGFLGSSDVTVAILDTGIDYQHADLAGRVDLSRSISFIPGDDALVAAFFPGAHPVTDIHFHGTHVASTAVSNGFAAAGVTSMSTLIGVKVCSVFGLCPGGAVFAGIVHAADAGADVINMSLGGGFLKRQAPGFVSVINRIFNYAKLQGVTVVVSAGNEALDLDHFPNLFKTYCDAPHVVCVSATGPTASGGVNGPWQNVDALAGYSNFGRSAISVAAPGGTGAGFVWAACSGTSLVIPICQTGTFVLGVTGTSMASPHAAGVAALLVHRVGANNPALVKSMLQRSADDLGQPGTDPAYGKGRVNASNAVH